MLFASGVVDNVDPFLRPPQSLPGPDDTGTSKEQDRRKEARPTARRPTLMDLGARGASNGSSTKRMPTLAEASRAGPPLTPVCHLPSQRSHALHVPLMIALVRRRARHARRNVADRPYSRRPKSRPQTQAKRAAVLRQRAADVPGISTGQDRGGSHAGFDGREGGRSSDAPAIRALISKLPTMWTGSSYCSGGSDQAGSKGRAGAPALGHGRRGFLHLFSRSMSPTAFGPHRLAMTGVASPSLQALSAKHFVPYASERDAKGGQRPKSASR